MASFSERQTLPNQVSPQDLQPCLEMRESLATIENEGISRLPEISNSIEELWITIPTSDGWQSRCKIIRPKLGPPATTAAAANPLRPLIVYFHGGGFGIGSPNMVTRPAREWAESFGATVVCPSYRLTPEFSWPVNVKDAWDVVVYVSKHAESDDNFGNVRLKDGFVVGGVSAGGTLAAVIGGLAAMLEAGNSVGGLVPADKLKNRISGLFVAIALLITKDIVPSQYNHLWTSRDDNWHSENVNTTSINSILTDLRCTDYTSPWFSPINILTQLSATPAKESEDTRNLQHPTTYIQSCALDPLRDDTIIYHKMLETLPSMEGRSKIDVFPNDGHAAWTALGYPSYSQNPTIEEATMEGMKWVLEKQ